MNRAPAIFIGHGSPSNLFEKGKYFQEVAKYSQTIDKPDKIIVVSAHWQDYMPIQITSTEKNTLIYDYYGFPDEYYTVKYDAPGDPNLSHEIVKKFNEVGLEAMLNNVRGLDHGTFMPLKIMYPDADIPTIQISIPYPRKNDDLVKIGQILRPFRDENIILIGSGNLTHNLRLAMSSISKYGMSGPIDTWAKDFDTWFKETLDSSEYEKIIHADKYAPNFKLAAPTTEHYDPIKFIIGATFDDEGFTTFHSDIVGGSLAMRSFATES